MSEELKACPFCGTDEPRILRLGGASKVICNECDSQSALYGTEEAAIIAWNMRDSNVDYAVGISEEADFERGTWTFKMTGDYKIGAGAYAISKFSPVDTKAKP